MTDYTPNYFYYEDLQSRRSGEAIAAIDWNHLWNLNQAATNNNSYALDCLINTGDMMTYWDNIQNGRLDVLENDIVRIDDELINIHGDIDDINEKLDNLDTVTGSFGLAIDVRKIKDYLYEAHYNDIDYRTAYDYFKEHAVPTFGCFAFRIYNYYGRNLDWFYNNNAEFIVHTPRIGKRYASVGISGGLMNEDEVMFINDSRYKLVPFALYDGINECGVVANVNVVPKITDGSPVIPAQDEKAEVPLAMVVRFILDNFSTADDAASYLVNHTKLLFSKSLIDMDYEIHIMIADKDDTFIIEFDQPTGGWVYGEVNSGQVMTNFKLTGTIPNDDWKYYTPLDVETNPAHNPVTVNNINPYGSGIERYNLIIDEKENVSNADDVMDILEQLKYTNAYDTDRVDTDTFWYTEFVSKNAGRTVGTPASDYANILPAIETIFANRSRDTGYTWQTVHSAVYDITAKRLYLVTQEDYTDVMTIDIEEQISGGGSTGDGDMKKSVYDTHNRAEDIFDYVDNHIPEIPVATASTAGIVKPDNSTIFIDSDGVISTQGSSEPNVQSTVWYRFAIRDLFNYNPDLSFVRMEVK